MLDIFTSPMRLIIGIALLFMVFGSIAAGVSVGTGLFGGLLDLFIGFVEIAADKIPIFQDPTFQEPGAVTEGASALGA